MEALRFDLDEDLPIAVAEQLRRRGVVAVTVRDLGLLGDSDDNHLSRATAMGHMLCTYDTDYVQLAMTGFAHAGIIIGQPEQHWIGEWAQGLTLYNTVYNAEDMRNRVEFL